MTAEPSPDAKMLAYALSDGGSDWHQVHIRDVETGKDLAETLSWTKFSGLAWTEDNRGFFYSRYPEPDPARPLQAVNRNNKLYYHVAGTPQAEDVLIYERPDHPDWSIAGQVTEAGRYLLLYLHQGTEPKTRLYYKDLGDPHHPNLQAPGGKLLEAFDADYRAIGN